MNGQYIYIDKGEGFEDKIPAHDCPDCEGTGEVTLEQRIVQGEDKCHRCDGEGLVPDDIDPSDDGDRAYDISKGN